MSDTEKKIADTQGKFMRALKNGQEITDATWQQCRVLLTTQRIALVADSKVTIPLSGIERLGERCDVNQAAASEANYATLHLGGDVVLLSTTDQEAFRTDFYQAILDNAVVYVKHPAVEGGVVQPTEWQRGRLNITAEAVRMVLEDGRKFGIDRDDIGELSTDEKDVAGEERAIIEVEHTDSEGTSVETHLSGRDNHISVLEQVLEEGAQQARVDLDLEPIERRVVMALYSGVSPFAISEFVDTDVDTVEEIYDRLIELDVVEVVRERREVGLTARGRKIAGEEMGER